MENEVFVEDRLLNYIWVYKDKQRKREKETYSKYFHPNINRGCLSSRAISKNSELPIKKNFRTKTQVWIEKEKKKLQKEIGLSVSAYKGKKPKVKPNDLKILQNEIRSKQDLQSNLLITLLNIIYLFDLILIFIDSPSSFKKKNKEFVIFDHNQSSLLSTQKKFPSNNKLMNTDIISAEQSLHSPKKNFKLKNMQNTVSMKKNNDKQVKRKLNDYSVKVGKYLKAT
jgi:hypothetical protein